MINVIKGSSPDRVKSKTIKFVFVASPLNMQHLRSKSKHGLAHNESEWGDMSICGLLFQ